MGPIHGIAHYKCEFCQDLFQVKLAMGEYIPDTVPCLRCGCPAGLIGKSKPEPKPMMGKLERANRIIELIKLCVEYGMQIPDCWVDELNRIGRKED
jgi:hypothetical protein